MVTASDEELACVKLIESCVQSAIGDFDIDPKPELRQVGVQYHIWQSGDLIAFFLVKDTKVIIKPWAPYRVRHFACNPTTIEGTSLFEGNAETFSLADPNVSKIVNFVASLRCNCGRSRHKKH